MMCCRGKRDTDIHLHRSKKGYMPSKVHDFIVLFYANKVIRGEEDLLDRDVADDVVKRQPF